MAVPISSMSSTIQDYGTPGSGNGAEKARWGCQIPDITVGNIVATNTALALLRLKTIGLTLGTEVHSATTSFEYDTAAEVTDPLAQRENKWLVRYHDDNGLKFKLEIPTAKLSLLSLGTEFLDLSVTAVADWVSAFEAIACSPADSSAGVTVDSIQFVGRKA